jgi:hypothetical protein
MIKIDDIKKIYNNKTVVVALISGRVCNIYI